MAVALFLDLTVHVMHVECAAQIAGAVAGRAVRSGEAVEADIARPQLDWHGAQFIEQHLLRIVLHFNVAHQMVPRNRPHASVLDC